MKKHSSKKVIIIGSGLAGLAACKKLKEFGIYAEILEARDRCGGRVWVDKNAFNIPIGRGAAWIHGNDNNPIGLIANKYQPKSAVVDPTQFIIYDHAGTPIANQEVESFNKKFAALLAKAQKLAHQASIDSSLAEFLLPLLKDVKLSIIEKDLLKAKLISLESYLGYGYEKLSAKYWDHEVPWPGENCFLVTGYQDILDDLQRDCLIRFNTVVTGININQNGVEVVAGSDIFQADAVLLTVPLGVLKRKAIRFDPPLPARKLKAIERIGMGLFNITALKFPKAFWPKECHAMMFSQFDSKSIPIFFNLYHFIPTPILIGYSSGERAHQLEEFSDCELIKKIMNNFKKVFGSILPEPESYINTRWGKDTFSYGSFSYMEVGADISDFQEIAAPVASRLFFAGEATCAEYSATTHGAFLTGVREAENIHQALICN